MNNKNIESTFKEKADSYKSDPRPKLWDKLEKRMDDHYATAPAQQLVSSAWMSYAAAFVLLIGAGFLLSKFGAPSQKVMAQHFTFEEINNTQEEDKVYKEMVDFSQRHYRMLINPGQKKKSAL